MSAGLVAAGLVAMTIFGKVMVDMASGEVRGRLEQLPYFILRLARRRLPAELRKPHHDDWWLPDLHERLQRDAEKPVTRLLKGVWYSSSLVVGAGRIARSAGVPSAWSRAIGVLLAVRTELGTGDRTHAEIERTMTTIILLALRSEGENPQGKPGRKPATLPQSRLVVGSFLGFWVLRCRLVAIATVTQNAWHGVDNTGS